MDRLYTLHEIAEVPGHFVYGLYDRTGLFYVGKTRQARDRFTRYTEYVQNNVHLLRRFREAGEDLRIGILNYRPADLAKAEKDAILEHAAKLVNRQGNPYRLPTGMHVELKREFHALAPCPLCDGPMNDRNQNYCRPCTDKLVRDRVGTKARARALSALAK